jgi:hypothetical protein
LPTYRFTGGFPRILLGLQEGPAAHHEGTPLGATIEVQPGDTLTTREPFTHPELEQVDGDAVPPVPPAEPTPAAPGEVTLTAEEIAHLSPEVLAQIHAAEETAHTDSAPAPETQE